MRHLRRLRRQRVFLPRRLRQYPFTEKGTCRSARAFFIVPAYGTP
ncbi:hypothetical protein LP421_27835 [Rhizobium sp. RCAM05350]|nr:hypothetical protein LP421_27835 [Rhizobium sp. RCAM05350]